MRNLSGSLGFAVRNADGTVHFTEIGKFYQDTVDNAINGIANGVFDYNTAIKKAVSALTNSGLRTVDYASGWSNRVDVAARRSVMTGIAQLTGKINEQNAEELDTDMFEVTWHGGARPSHQVWQGRWYTKKQLVSVCGLGSVTGLCGANCYHDYYPVIPGISEPTYTEEQLREMNRKENIPVEYGGKQYTKYEALQRQRRLETKMRAQRQEIHLLEVGGASEDDIIAARCRYRVTSGEYTRFSKAVELPQQRERVTVDGLGNVGVGKWKKKVDISGESDIINKYRGKGISVQGLSEISDETVKKVEKATKKVTSDFKILEKCSEPIAFGDTGDGALASNDFLPSTGRNQITLSKAAFSDPIKLEQLLKQDYLDGVSYEVKGIESLVAHEMGHNAHVALALKRAGLLYGVPLRTDQIIRFNEEYFKISQEIYLAAFDDENFTEISELCASQLGTMTVEDAHELIAQSFGNYYYGKSKSKIAKKIVKYFIKELK